LDDEAEDFRKMVTSPQASTAWKRIADDLCRLLENGDMQVGDCLPPAADLATRYGVHRHTVRQAYLHLQELGLVRTEQGRGTFFQGAQLVYPLGRRVRFRENLRRQALDPKSTIISCDKVPAPANLAVRLGLKPGEPIWRAIMLNLTGTKPLSIGRHHVSLKRAPNLDEHLAKAGGSFTAAFAASGICDYIRQSTKISARLASGDEAEWLKLEPRAPVLVTNGLDCDKEDMPLQVTEAIFRADKMELLVENER
jgi:GntR family phosphonate transport system transcriptional regulator